MAKIKSTSQRIRRGALYNAASRHLFEFLRDRARKTGKDLMGMKYGRYVIADQLNEMGLNNNDVMTI